MGSCDSTQSYFNVSTNTVVDENEKDNLKIDGDEKEEKYFTASRVILMPRQTMHKIISS